jgi:mRNA-degrading endonuclease RelE of RelBE toxin-antitoxin system
VLLHPKAAAFLRNSEENIAQRIRERLKELCEEPAGKGERLRHSTYYRLRIGDYRAIYMLEEGNTRSSFYSSGINEMSTTTSPD